MKYAIGTNHIYTYIHNEGNSVFEDKVSNCCNAPIIEETDICSDCKEHCDVEYTSEDLENKSFEEQLIVMGE